MLIDAYTMKTLENLRRFARIVFIIAVVASLGANYLHAPTKATAVATGIAAVIAMWPSLALLLGTELVIRIPLKGAATTLVVARVIATVVVTGIAGWVSYRHMQAVAAEYGEGQGLNANLFPISVDGLMVIASVSLVQLNYMILQKAFDAHKKAQKAEADTAAEASQLASEIAARIDAEKSAADAAAQAAATIAALQSQIAQPVQPQQQPVPVPVQRATRETNSEAMTPQAFAKLRPRQRVEEIVRMHPTVTQISMIAALAKVSPATVHAYFEARNADTETPVFPEDTETFVPEMEHSVNGHQS